jgi:thioredoxin
MTESLFDVNAEDWETKVLGSKEPVLVDFWHDACMWCKRLEPELADVARDFTPGFKFARLNVLSSEANSQLGQKYGIMGTPTLILFCNGRVLEQLVGYRPKDKLRKEVQEMVGNYRDCFKQSTPLRS